ALRDFPSLPPIANFPDYKTIPDITSSRVLTPDSYGNIKLNGNQTLTFKGPGIYVINQIDNKNSNTFVFDFDNQASGAFLIYVHGNANLAKVNVSLIKGGNASRVFTEVHGKGSGSGKYAFELANGSPGGTKSRWEGTVWAPYAGINVGSGTGSSDITGALWSATQVNVQSGVNIQYAPFTECVPPALSVVDANVCSANNGGTTATINLNDFVTIPGNEVPSFSINGAPIGNPATYLATNGDVVTVTIFKSTTCSATDTIKINVNDKQSFGICAPLQGKTNDLIGSELTSLYQVFKAGGNPTSSEVFFIIGDKVQIDIVYFPARLSELLGILTGLGLTDYVVNDDGSLIITGFFPIINLTQLNPLVDLINHVHPSFPPINNSGTTTTLGDQALRSDLVRLGYDIGGAGIKIGILS
ncbi:MAG: hypothetical protein C0490_25810, partial [Marivirga sp.]|nr:hypothetical protein [Marivirga sp.]